MNPEDQRTNCPGFLDEYGNWNNGFECPSVAGQRRICCGSESRRYCCTMEDIHGSSLTSLNLREKSPLLTNQTKYSFMEKINLTFLTLPTLLSCFLIIILLLLFISIILLICYRCHKRHKNYQEEHISTNQTLLVDHFPFSPPHHQLYLNENNPQTYLLQPKTKDTLTISTSSSSSSSAAAARVPSDIYYNDWKEFLSSTEQSTKLYAAMSSQKQELNENCPHLHSSYLFYGKHHQSGVIV